MIPELNIYAHNITTQLEKVELLNPIFNFCKF